MVVAQSVGHQNADVLTDEFIMRVIEERESGKVNMCDDSCLTCKENWIIECLEIAFGVEAHRE